MAGPALPAGLDVRLVPPGRLVLTVPAGAPPIAAGAISAEAAIGAAPPQTAVVLLGEAGQTRLEAASLSASARTDLLQQGQDTVITQFRDGVDSLAPGVAFPPSRTALLSFATGVSHTQRTANWRVMASYDGMTATSRPGDTFAELTWEMRESVRTKAATVFQRVSTDHGPAPRRSTSLRRARRNPRPGARNEIASSRLVLPAPFGPVRTTGRGSTSRRRLA